MHDCHNHNHKPWPFASRRGGFRGPFGMDWDFGAESHGRHERKRRFSGTELRLVLLKLIADEPRHGYELMKALEELTDGAYSPSPGTVYPTLSLLEDEGAIAERVDDGPGEGGGKRKAFEATDAGRAELEERAEEVERLMARLAELGGRRERERGSWPQLWRAMGNLAGVLRNRFRDGGLDAATIDEIVDIIDEAAKRIERM
jgi:DNA-binding PadR family transcriptional regulator